MHFYSSVFLLEHLCCSLKCVLPISVCLLLISSMCAFASLSLFVLQCGVCFVCVVSLMFSFLLLLLFALLHVILISPCPSSASLLWVMCCVLFYATFSFCLPILVFVISCLSPLSLLVDLMFCFTFLWFWTLFWCFSSCISLFYISFSPHSGGFLSFSSFVCLSVSLMSLSFYLSIHLFASLCFFSAFPSLLSFISASLSLSAPLIACTLLSLDLSLPMWNMCVSCDWGRS